MDVVRHVKKKLEQDHQAGYSGPDISRISGPPIFG
jgi:hypothetical protein